MLLTGVSPDSSLLFGRMGSFALQVYTRGYDDTFGAVEISMPGAPGVFSGQRFLLHGCCNRNHVTQGELLVLNVGQAVATKSGTRLQPENTGMHGFGIPPHTNATLRLMFVKDKYEKFAVKFLSSC